MKLMRIGVDLAKNVFQIHGVDCHEQPIWRQCLPRDRWLQTVLEKIEPGCEIGMESCGGAHHWARQLQDAVMSRYEGKPFLKLLDFYVLKSIGRIEPEQLNALAQLEPKLRETYATQGTWFEIVAEQMDLPDELPSNINAAWDSYSKHMQQKGLTADPMEFTYRFVDTNLIAN